jgi:hypothetical protein
MRAHPYVIIGLLAWNLGCTKFRVANPDGGDSNPAITNDVGVDDTAVFWLVETRAMAATATLNSAKIFKLAR